MGAASNHPSMVRTKEEDEAKAHRYLAALGEAIRNRRKPRWSSDDFARHIGLGRSYFGAVERGSQNLTLGNLMTILEGLEVAPGTFFQAINLLDEEGPMPAITRKGLPKPQVDASAPYGRMFGAALRYERERLGVTQEDFAHAVGFSRAYLSTLEAGRRNPTFLVIARILEALQLPPRTFFKHLHLRPTVRQRAAEPGSSKLRNKARLRAQS